MINYLLVTFLLQPSAFNKYIFSLILCGYAKTSYKKKHKDYYL